MLAKVNWPDARLDGANSISAVALGTGWPVSLRVMRSRDLRRGTGTYSDRERRDGSSRDGSERRRGDCDLDVVERLACDDRQDARVVGAGRSRIEQLLTRRGWGRRGVHAIPAGRQCCTRNRPRSSVFAENDPASHSAPSDRRSAVTVRRAIGEPRSSRNRPSTAPARCIVRLTVSAPPPAISTGARGCPRRPARIPPLSRARGSFRRRHPQTDPPVVVCCRRPGFFAAIPPERYRRAPQRSALSIALEIDTTRDSAKGRRRRHPVARVPDLKLPGASQAPAEPWQWPCGWSRA